MVDFALKKTVVSLLIMAGRSARPLRGGYSHVTRGKEKAQTS